MQSKDQDLGLLDKCYFPDIGRWRNRSLGWRHQWRDLKRILIPQQSSTSIRLSRNPELTWRRIQPSETFSAGLWHDPLLHPNHPTIPVCCKALRHFRPHRTFAQVEWRNFLRAKMILEEATKISYFKNNSWRCDFSGSKEAGSALAKMLSLGSSKPWQVVFHQISNGPKC